jgi:hypothetical protein
LSTPMCDADQEVHTGRVKNRRVCVCALVVVLLLAGTATWHWWPRPVAPELTSQMVKAIDSSGNTTISLIAGGSKRDANTLWKRYHDRPAYGTPPEAPRLLGVSLVKLTTDSFPGSGTYWVVYSDRVWGMPSIGEGNFGRQAIFLDPKTLRDVMTMEF